MSETGTLLNSYVSDKIVKFDVSGSVEICGYDVPEVETLLTVYRDHLRAMGTLASEVQSGQDAVRYTPFSPEDVLGEDTRG